MNQQQVRWFLDPRIKGGLNWIHYHIILALVLAGLIIGILALLGVFAYKELGGSYFRYHCVETRNAQCVKHQGFKAPLKVPTKHVAAKPKAVFALPASYHIKYSYLPHPGNQDGIGSCQAWAIFNYQLAYQYNIHYNRFWGTNNFPRRFSSHFAYSWATNGQDVGSYPQQEFAVAENPGIMLWRNYPYGNAVTRIFPNIFAYGVEPQSGIPGVVVQQAHKYSLSIHDAFDYPGAGFAGVDNIKSYMTQYQTPANLDIPVYPEWDNASLYGGKVGLPRWGESSRGGHAITLIGWNDSIKIQNGDGTTSTGAFIGINQWGTNWGGTLSLANNNGTNGGYFALSYNFVAQYGFGAEIATINWPAAKSGLVNPDTFRNPHPHKLVPPPPGSSTNLPKPGVGGWYVYKVMTTDLGGRNFDLSPALNAVGDRIGVAPVGLAATLGSECALKTGNGNHVSLYDDCSRYGVWPDVSFGACQVSVATAGQFGYGNSAFSQGNVNYVHLNLENYPNTCVQMEGAVMGNYAAYTHVPYPYLNVAWNCGPGWGTAFFYHPTGQCATNFYNDFLGWYNYSLRNWAVPFRPQPQPRPAPQPFNKHLWNSYRISHHKKTIPYSHHHKLVWAASIWYGNDTTCGGIVHKDIWFPRHKGQEFGYSMTQFQHCKIFTWPHYHRGKVQRT